MDTPSDRWKLVLIGTEDCDACRAQAVAVLAHLSNRASQLPAFDLWVTSAKYPFYQHSSPPQVNVISLRTIGPLGVAGGVIPFPMAFVVDKRGVVRYAVAGYMPQAVDRLLDTALVAMGR